MRAKQIPNSTQLLIAVVAALSVAPLASSAQATSAAYKGQTVRIGKGSAHTVVRTDASGKPVTVSIVFTESALEGLPSPVKRGRPDVPYLLPMPTKGPKTVIDHVVINWEPGGHPPPKVYDVPHFDFHFYLSGRKAQQQVRFKSEAESGDPSQQPPAELMAAGYVIPPGTAVPTMGVHAINPAASEFNGQPFTATFIYGYHNKQLTFLEPMATIEFLKSKPTFSAPVARPAKYLKAGAYPSSYSVKYEPESKSYEVSLEDLQ